MNILLIIQNSRAVDGGHSDLVPFDIMHVILVHPELSAGQRHSGHLVLEGGDIEGTWDHVVEKQLEDKRGCYRSSSKFTRSCYYGFVISC